MRKTNGPNILWDFMKTLVLPRVKEVFIEYMNSGGKSLAEEKCKAHKVGYSELITEMLSGKAKHALLDLEFEIRAAYMNDPRAVKKLKQNCEEYMIDGALEALVMVRKLGGYNNIYSAGVPFLKILGLSPDFRPYKTVDSLIDKRFYTTQPGVPSNKRDPQSYLKIQEETGPLSFHINDSVDECNASFAAGITTYHFKQGSSLYLKKDGISVVGNILQIPELSKK